MFLYVANPKGGSGNSMVSMLALHHFRGQGLDPVLIDADSGIHDVHRVYEGMVDCHDLNLCQELAWERMIRIITESGDNPVVVNSPSGYLGNELYVRMLDEGVVLWTMEQNRDSVHTLEKFLALGAKPRMTLVKNGFWGEEDEFKALKESRFCGWPAVYLPKAPDFVRKMVFNERVPVERMLDRMRCVERAVAAPWIEEATACIAKAIEIAKKVA